MSIKLTSKQQPYLEDTIIGPKQSRLWLKSFFNAWPKDRICTHVRLTNLKPADIKPFYINIDTDNSTSWQHDQPTVKLSLSENQELTNPAIIQAHYQLAFSLVYFINSQLTKQRQDLLDTKQSLTKGSAQND